jgi:hypothetical protein
MQPKYPFKRHRNVSLTASIFTDLFASCIRLEAFYAAEIHIPPGDNELRECA